ncbi:MAG: 50S ribosomal protein L18a [Candidatus Heimdallarchaeota archaeon]|nr:MAG: 50S ribosomal protein L18a [Candidatus Heimdallarchaeota archaeon]
MKPNVSVKIFRISGSFKQRRQVTSFSQELCALTEDDAKEKLFSEFGSRNRLKRRQIQITSIENIPPEEVSDPFVQKLITNEFKIPYED